MLDFDDEAVELIACRMSWGNRTEYGEALSKVERPGKLLRASESKSLGMLGEVLRDAALVSEVKQELRAWQKQGIGVVCISDSRFPANLKAMRLPPRVLFYRGDLAALSQPVMLAVVGSRQASVESIRFAMGLLSKLRSPEVCIVSGLALGIDAAAHEAALDWGLPAATVAVMGNGLLTCYPRSNEALAARIIESKGLLLSRFEPETPPYPSNFLERNRVIAGLARAVLVVQAAERSGSLVTARWAMDEGRDVLVAPGAAWDRRYRGSNSLLRDGAAPVLDENDVREMLGLEKKEDAALQLKALPALQLDLISQIEKAGRLRFQELLDRAGPRASVDVMELEAMGIIRRLPGDILELIG